MIRRVMLGLLAVTISLQWTAPAARAEEPAAKLRPVKLVLNWLPEPEFGGMYQAQLDGTFAQHGLDVQIISGGPGVPTLDMTARGRAQFGVAAADEVVRARATGRQLRAVFAVFQTNPQGLMVHAQRGLDSLEALWKAPGTLAVQPGLPYVTFFREKWGESQARLVPYGGGVELFLARKDYAQQCFVFAEPIAAQAGGAQPKVFLIADAGFNPYAAVVITTDEIAQRDPALVKAMTQALREGWASYLRDPARANAHLGQLNTAMNEEVLTAAFQAQKPFVQDDFTIAHGLGAMSQERWATLIEQLISLDDALTPANAPKAEDCFVNAVGNTATQVAR
jgi:NitT/TauT family transport system substrate-binding protein